MTEEQKQNRSLEMCRRVVTTESFIKEAKEVWGDLYDYSKVEYKNRDHRVTVICPVHGEFQVYAREHLDGKGCPKCEKGKKFISKLKTKFGDKFGLEKYVYQSSTTPVTLVCPKHGEFSKLPNSILSSTFGCPECAKEASQEKHNASVMRLEKEKENKRKEYEAQNERRVQELRQEREAAKIKREKLVNEFLAHPTSYNPDIPFWMFMQSVNEHIDDICYDAKWREPFRETFRMPDSEAQKLKYYKEGDIFYKYCNEAPNDAVRKSFEVIPRDGKSLEEYLNKRNCIIHIDGSDLIIQKVSEENISGDDNKKYSSSSKNSGICHLPNSFVSIDFETLYPQRVSVCSIGMVKYLNGNIIDRYYSLIQPPLEYPGKKGNELTWVHGITKDMLIGKKTFDVILPDIEAFVGNLPLVAHNASVESSCIREICTYYGITTKLDYRHIFDTLAISKDAEKSTGLKIEGSGTHSLEKVCERFHVTVKNHHNALDDAEMCGDLMKIFYKILVEHQPLVSLDEDNASESCDMGNLSQEEQIEPIINSYREDTVKENAKTGCLGILIVLVTTLLIVSSFI